MSKIKEINSRYTSYSVKMYNLIIVIREYMKSHDDKRTPGFLPSELRDALKQPSWLVHKALKAMEKAQELESQFLYGRRWYRFKEK